MAKLVNWHSFDQKLRQRRILVFGQFDIRKVFGVTKTAATFLLHRYAKRGFIARVRRGLYTFTDGMPSELFLANKIYEPSYISLEFALAYHRVLPETVYEITSVTTKPRRRFAAGGTIFSYRRIKKSAFTGYSLVRQGGAEFFIADPEKAFVDLLYLRLKRGARLPSRFHKEKLNKAKALRYAKLFAHAKLAAVVAAALS